MYRYEFEFEDNMEDVSGLILDKTINKVKELQKQFNKEVFPAICDDIESWMYERFDNVRRQYFDAVVAFLLDQDNTHVTDKETLSEWLSGIGYTQAKFRTKIYEDNKEIINKSITGNAVYETLENMFETGYFRSWKFSDITKGYPQSIIIRKFMRELVKRDGFDEEIKAMLDAEAKEKLARIAYLKEELKQIEQRIEEID